jgi:hypothetical protein
MKSVRILMLMSIFSLTGSLATADDWPQWRGPNRDGVSKETGLLKAWPTTGPKLLWTFEEAGVGYSSPAIVSDRLYVLGAEDPEKGDREFAICVNAKNGKEIWREKLDNSPGGYLTQWGGGPRSSPTVDGDFLYILGARGDLQCRKTADGSKVWGINLVKDLGGKIPSWGYCESVLIDGDRLLCMPGGAKGTFACLKKKTGEVEWRSTDLKDGASYSSIVIGSKPIKQYITVAPTGAVGIRASDGKLLWKSAAGKNGTAVIPTPVVSDRFVFATSGYGSGCGAVELEADGSDGVKAKDLYLSKTMINHHGGVIRVGEFIYGYSDKGGWMCLDYLKLEKDNDDPVWKSNKLEKGSLTFADGHFYCYGQKGVCALIEANPKEWKESGRFEIPKKTQFPRKSGNIWTHPVVANGKLFLRDHELIFCYDLKGLD